MTLLHLPDRASSKALWRLVFLKFMTAYHLRVHTRPRCRRRKRVPQRQHVRARKPWNVAADGFKKDSRNLFQLPLGILDSCRSVLCSFQNDLRHKTSMNCRKVNGRWKPVLLSTDIGAINPAFPSLNSDFLPGAAGIGQKCNATCRLIEGH